MKFSIIASVAVSQLLLAEASIPNFDSSPINNGIPVVEIPEARPPLEEHTDKRRNIDNPSYRQMKIRPYFGNLAASGISDASITNVKEVTSAAIRYLERVFSVEKSRRQLTLVPNCASELDITDYTGSRVCGTYQTPSLNCAGYDIPEELFSGPEFDSSGNLLPNQNAGLVDTDYVLLVSADESDCSTNSLAFASACLNSNRYGSPFAGVATFCPKFFDLDYSGQVGTTVHEILHGMGFTGDTSKFLKEDYSDFRPLSETRMQDTANDRFFIISPQVQALAREHFNCNTLSGVPFEDDGAPGSVGAHWEETYLQRELMGSTKLNEHYLSKFTLAFFDDSGWFKPDYRFAQPFTFGRNAGCDVFKDGDQCIDHYLEREALCSDRSVLHCSADHSGYGYCTSTSNTNQCPDVAITQYCPRGTSCLDNGVCFKVNCADYNDSRGVYETLEVISNDITYKCTDASDVLAIPGYVDVHCPYEIETICGTEKGNTFQCVEGHWNNEMNQCVCDPGFKGTVCDQRDTQIVTEVQNVVGFVPENVCISGSASEAMNNAKFTISDRTPYYGQLVKYTNSLNTDMTLEFDLLRGSWTFEESGNFQYICYTGMHYNPNPLDCIRGTFYAGQALNSEPSMEAVVCAGDVVNPITGNPDGGNPDTGNPDTGNPDTGNPDTGNPDTGNPDTGNPDTGNPDTGNPDTGNPDTGNPDTGNPDTGNPDTGNPDTGNPDTTNPDSPGSGAHAVKTATLLLAVGAALNMLF